MLSTAEYFHASSSLTIHKAPQIEDIVENKVQLIQSRKKTKVKENDLSPENKPYLCNQCKKGFGKKSSLARHVQEQHENKASKTVSCDVEGCIKSYRNNSHLERHKKISHLSARDTQRPMPATNYSCIYCDLSFKRQDKLHRHIFTHTKEKKFHCTVEGCDKSYANKSHLNRHKKSVHETKPEIAAVQCIHDNCQQMFTNKSNMKRHYNTHHVHLLPYSCSHCNEKFRRKLQLRKHEIQKHSQDYPFSCNQCNKGFLSSYTYSIHVAAHLDGTPQQLCKDCGETFSKWSLLVEHRRRLHKNDKRFACDLCCKTFSRKPNIKQHMLAHLSTVTLFECHYDNCPKFYNAKRNLLSHIRSKHEGKRWKCDLCDREMSTMQKLKQHINAHLDPKRSKLLRKTFHSTTSKLLGVELHSSIEKKIIDGHGAEVSIETFPPLESTHETSGTELSDF